MAAAASVHHQQVDGVTAHIEHTQSHPINLTGLSVNSVSGLRCGEADVDFTGRHANHDQSKLLCDDGRGNLAFGGIER
jgi:hypothetical protein